MVVQKTLKSEKCDIVAYFKKKKKLVQGFKQNSEA